MDTVLNFVAMHEWMQLIIGLAVAGFTFWMFSTCQYKKEPVDGFDFFSLKHGDRVSFQDPFYGDIHGQVIDKRYADGYDCTIFEGYVVEDSQGRKFVRQPKDLSKDVGA